ncbi:MAG: YheC/YheD family protein [Bacillus sp. (in: Bacteria)]|nr:YheC/YheD family protein [Bacillus sp. (in: firmicutes)]
MFNDTYLINSIVTNEKLPENQVAIPIKAATLWRLSGRSQIKLQYHFFSKEIELVAEPHLTEFEMEMHPAIKEQLHVPLSNIQCQYSQTEHILRLGPSLGVVLGDINEENKEAPFGSLTAYLTDMAITAERLHCPLMIFSFKAVEGSFVKGYMYQNKSWQPTKSPLPQVIYNRIGRRDMERSISCQAFFDKLSELNIPYFNDRFLHKWETFSMFLQEPTLIPYLPETRSLQSSKDLKTSTAKI